MRRLAVVCAGLVLTAAAALGASFPAARGQGGAVASAEATATEAGLELLAGGGNAVDAAVAVALALTVVHPEAAPLGGGGFAVVRFAGHATSLDFREVAPAAAHRDMYLDDQGVQVPGASTLGPLAAGVPGSPAGLHALHERYGKRPWAEVVAPAIRLAADGFPVSRRLHEELLEDRAWLEHFESTVAIWLPDGKPPAIGSTLEIPELAATLERYAAEGPTALTEGPLAEAIVAASDAHGGVLTTADLAAYRPVWREIVQFDAYGWRFAAMDLPSSGGIILGQTFGMLERLGWRELPRFGADRAHLLVETWRRAFADRFLLGDPATSQATATDLLAADWLDQRTASIDRARATPSEEVEPRAGVVSEANETTHVAVIDGDGNVVSLTATLNGGFGCGLVVPGVGFLLNNEMDDFTAVPGRPNLYGLIQGDANSVRPGRRMLSSMSPVIAWKGNEILAAGGRGGSRIPTATGQVLLNVIVDGDGLQAAIDRPRLHHQWLPDTLGADLDRLAPETVAELERRGHAVKLTPQPVKVNAIRRRADGSLEAAADPRGPAVAGVSSPEVPAIAMEGDSP